MHYAYRFKGESFTGFCSLIFKSLTNKMVKTVPEKALSYAFGFGRCLNLYFIEFNRYFPLQTSKTKI